MGTLARLRDSSVPKRNQPPPIFPLLQRVIESALAAGRDDLVTAAGTLKIELARAQAAGQVTL